MPKKKKKGRGGHGHGGSSMSMHAFLGDAAVKNDLPSAPAGLPSGPRGFGERRNPWATDRNVEPTKSERSSNWRAGGGMRSSGPSRSSGGLTVSRNPFDTQRNRWRGATQDPRFSGDSRPSHLRQRFFKSEANAEAQRKAQEQREREAKEKQEQEALRLKQEEKEKHESEVAARRAKNPALMRGLARYNSVRSPLENAIADFTSLASDGLTESFHRLNLSKTSAEEVGVTLANSLVDKKFTLSDLLSGAQEDIESAEDCSAIILATMTKLRAKGRPTCRDIIGDVSLDAINDIIRTNQSDAEYDTLLDENDAYFLKPIPDITDEIADLLDQKAAAAAVLKAIDAKVDAKQVPTSLTGLIATHLMDLVFESKSKTNLSVIEDWKSVLVRCQEDEEEQAKLLFTAQRTWFRNGKKGDLIRPLFEKFYSLEIVTFEGISAWRDDRSKANKGKGKVQALLKLTSWIAEITPVVEEEDDEEEDGEEEMQDEYLVNPNAEFFA